MSLTFRPRVHQFSPQDIGGGAERVALDLHVSLRQRGCDARLSVRHKRSEFDGVQIIDIYDGTSTWSRLIGALDQLLVNTKHFRGRDTIRNALAKLAVPARWVDHRTGLDDFHYPYTHRLLDQDWRPDVIHLHNLHGGYFDLSALPQLSKRVPIVWTLHDTWAITGHCAYFIDCGRWPQGCGDCPDLTRAPAIRKDRTRDNWLRKQAIYADSRLCVVCPSNWLMFQVENSILQPAATIRCVIPNGVDRTVFRPGDKQAARCALGLPEEAFVGLFVAVSGSTPNPYKDFSTIKQAIAYLKEKLADSPVQWVCLGGQVQPTDHTDGVWLFPGRISDPKQVALYYQAADIYLHAANADNFPCTVLEAQASGLPVVATAVGGILEQIKDGTTGFLVDRGDSFGMAERVRLLIQNAQMRQAMAQQAAARAACLFDLTRQANDYLNLYQQLLASRQGGQSL